MNENAKRWVEELRSGKWLQAQKALRKTDFEGPARFCCLGVACELSGLGTWDGTTFQDQQQAVVKARKLTDTTCPTCSELTWEDGSDCECNARSEEFTSPMVQAWLGLTSEDGELVLDGKTTSLAQLNDAGKSFAEIADIIERNADQLFESDSIDAEARDLVADLGGATLSTDPMEHDDE